MYQKLLKTPLLIESHSSFVNNKICMQGTDLGTANGVPLQARRLDKASRVVTGGILEDGPARRLVERLRGLAPGEVVLNARLFRLHLVCARQQSQPRLRDDAA